MLFPSEALREVGIAGIARSAACRSEKPGSHRAGTRHCRSHAAPAPPPYSTSASAGTTWLYEAFPKARFVLVEPQRGFEASIDAVLRPTMVSVTIARSARRRARSRCSSGRRPYRRQHSPRDQGWAKHHSAQLGKSGCRCAPSTRSRARPRILRHQDRRRGRRVEGVARRRWLRANSRHGPRRGVRDAPP